MIAEHRSLKTVISASKSETKSTRKLGNITLYKNRLTFLRVELDSIQLSVFSNRFMSIAEQMGKTLQRTAISTNIKERLDFSCALFGVCFKVFLIFILLG